uniref:C2 domain-containing protein n=1 Tax=Tetranychus urticae TaxID=32264 RepID=T1JV62_TETUR
MDTPCKLNSYCLSNICTHLDDFPGKAQLYIKNGYFYGLDRWTQTDTYIKVYSVSKLSGFKYIGRTRTIHDDDRPDFDETFTTEISSKEGSFILEIFDLDYNSPDDLISRVEINFKDCLKLDVCTKNFGSSRLRYNIIWTPQI